MSLKSVNASKVSGENSEGIAVISDHDQRPDANSMRKYAAETSLEKPWSLRFKTAVSLAAVNMLATKVTKQVEPHMWLIEGTVNGSPVQIFWSTLSIQGTMYSKKG